jgi:MFS transporter, DHA2 family, multidrug resistance protein
LLVITVFALVLFVLRQRRAANPLYDAKVARRPTFWVAAVGGIIVLGALMGGMFVGQQFMYDVLGFSTVQAALPALFAGAFMMTVAPRSAKIVVTRGSRLTLLAGYLFVLLGFLTMLPLWNETAGFWGVVLAIIFVGIGVG